MAAIYQLNVAETFHIEAMQSEKEIPQDASPYLFCDVCGHYPIKPMHGHYVCPACFMPTKCCEAGPIPAAWSSAEKEDLG